MKKISLQLFWITILFFALGLIHISLSLIGILCFVIPFIQYRKYNDKVWCKYYCPRAGYFEKIISKLSRRKKIPTHIDIRKIKKGVLYYFGINLFFALMSTLMVTLGKIDPIEQVRFLIIFGMPFDLYQLLELNLPANMIHFSYRVYSMMFSSVIIGSLLGIFYQPRTWCSICPINTLTTKKANPQ